MVNHAGYLPSSQWLLIDIVLDVAEQPWKGHLLNDLLRVVHTKVCSGEGKKLIRPLLNTMWLPPPTPLESFLPGSNISVCLLLFLQL